jgi:hypothetical protein
MGAPFSNGGRPQHINGTATTTATQVGPSMNQESACLFIGNLDATNNLLLSFDDGANWFTVLPKSYVTLPVQVKGLKPASAPAGMQWNGLQVKSSAATAAYSILWVSVI